MTAIAQLLDGTETFETKEELFDYVFSQLFMPKRIISIEPFIFEYLENQTAPTGVTIMFNNPNNVFHF